MISVAAHLDGLHTYLLNKHTHLDFLKGYDMQRLQLPWATCTCWLFVQLQDEDEIHGDVILAVTYSWCLKSFTFTAHIFKLSCFLKLFQLLWMKFQFIWYLINWSGACGWEASLPDATLLFPSVFLFAPVLSMSIGCSSPSVCMGTTCSIELHCSACIGIMWLLRTT